MVRIIRTELSNSFSFANASLIRKRIDYEDFYICSVNDTNQLVEGARCFLDDVRKYIDTCYKSAQASFHDACFPTQGYGVYIDWMLEESNGIVYYKGRGGRCRVLCNIRLKNGRITPWGDDSPWNNAPWPFPSRRRQDRQPRSYQRSNGPHGIRRPTGRASIAPPRR